jgi:hypothetical protein
MSTPEQTPETLKRAKRASWLHRLVGLSPFSWYKGPAVALPYWRSYTDQDEDGTMERWETVYVMFRRTSYRPNEPRAYFWRYDGRKRLVVNLPLHFFFCAGFDYTDILLPNDQDQP